MRMSRKGASRIDNVAHTLMEFNPSVNMEKTVYKAGYTAYYHDELLYSVRDNERGIVSLVYANSPFAAIEKCRAKGGAGDEDD